MKDTEARKRLDKLERGFKEHQAEKEHIFFKYCPKCKRETLVRPDPQSWTDINSSCTMGGFITQANNSYECLICGTVFEVRKESVIIKRR